MLSTNQTLQNRYRIVSQLGQIDSGVGYSAFDTVSGKTIMLKESLLEPDTVPTVLVSESVQHQSLLCAVDQFDEDGKNYLVMDHTDGYTLGELLEKKRGPFPAKDVALWSDGLLDALHHLHTQSPPIVHSNIKPQNIKLSAGGNVKLYVFGANGAKSVAAEVLSFDATVLGYLPIEQIWLGLDAGSRKVIRSGYDEKSAEILELPLDVQSDVYSIAATLYHLLTGRVPVDALTRSIDLLEGKPDPIVPVSRFNPAVPAEVSEVLLRAMEIKRENRYGSASILRQVLRSSFARLKDAVDEPRTPTMIEDDAILEVPKSRPAAPARPAVPVAKPAAASVPVVPAPPRVNSSGVQSEESRQLDMIKRQLREAEARRLEAEQRAAEAEKKLLERETVEFKVSDAMLPESSAPAAPEPVVNAGHAAPLIAETPYVREFDDQPVDFSDAFQDEPTGRRSIAKVAGIGVLVLVLGAAGFGVMTFMSGTAPEPQSQIVTPKAPVPVAETNPVADSPVVASGDQNQQTVAENAIETDRNAVDPALKSKPTQTPPQQAKKQPSPSPKSTQPQKKSVTLDDLLKDN